MQCKPNHAWCLVVIGLLSIGPVFALAAPTTAFTYQGQLTDAGEPVTDTANFDFMLYDAATGGNLVGTYSVPGIDVVDGLFSVDLDFGAGAFPGEPRWLEITVQLSSGGDPVTLSPRQPIRPAPYALYALDGAGGSGESQWVDHASGIYYSAGNIGIGEVPSSMLSLKITAGDGEYALYAYSPDTAAGTTINAENDVLAGRAVWGQASGSGTTYGVGGYAESPDGFGVHGDNQSSMGDAVGVFGRTNSPTGFGGYFIGKGHFSGDLNVGGTAKMSGFQLSTTPAAGYVLTSDPNGVGTWQPGGSGSSPWSQSGTIVYYNGGNVGIGTSTPDSRFHVVDPVSFAITAECTGEGTAGILGGETAGVEGYGSSYGVWAQAASAAGAGVRGRATSTTGVNKGVWGETVSPDGYGVWGSNDADSGNFTAVGVYGSTTAPRGVGVKGYAPGADGGYGVWGRATGPSGRGVYAESTATSGNTIGLEAYVASPTGAAVYAFNEAESGYAVAIQGDTNSPDGFGGYFRGKGHFSGNVGIGTDSPTEMLDVVGTVRMDGFQLSTAPTTGYVLTSDDSGVGTWQAATGGGSTPWQIDGDDNIWYSDGNVGIGMGAGDPPLYPLHVTTYSGPAIMGQTTAATGSTYGVYGQVASGNGHGVFGRATGVNGRGVYGEASNGTGVEGYTESPTKYAVYGFNEAESGNAVGVRGDSNSSIGWGVHGNCNGDYGRGVFGEVTGLHGYGVWGHAVGGSGVYGEASATSGGTGVSGWVESSTGIGVLGTNDAGTGDSIAVKGVSGSPEGYGGYFEGRGYFSGNVGIGRTNPTERLHVVGDVRVDGERLRLGREGSDAYIELHSDEESDSTEMHIKSLDTVGLAVTNSGDQDLFVVTQNGRVGIGNINPSQALDVSGTVKMSGVQLGTSATPGHVLTTDASGVGTWQELAGSQWEGAGGGLDIYYTGQVGIGTTNPQYQLQVESSDAATIRVDNTSTIGEYCGVNAEVDSPDGYALKGSASSLTGDAAGVFGQSFSPDGAGVNGRNLSGGYGVYGQGETAEGGWAGYFSGRGYFSGDVGIGQIDPQAKLDVNGTVKMSGFQLGTSSTSGYVLTCDSTGVGTWQESTGGDTFELPYEGTVSSTTSALSITNTGTAPGSKAISAVINNPSSNSDAAAGFFSANGSNGTAVYATSDAGAAVEAYHSGPNYAFYGISSGSGGARFSCSTEDGFGVKGVASADTGVDTVGGWFESDSALGKGVLSLATGDAGTAICGESSGILGVGISAKNASTISAALLAMNYVGGPLIEARNSTTNTVFEVANDGTTSVSVLHITGGADLAEKFDVSEQVEPGMVVEIDPDNPGKLRVARGEYNRRVAGVVSGANELSVGMVLGQLPGEENATPIALSGRVWVYCDATEQAIEPGDMLTTAERPGHAMPVRDYSRAHGTVIGKAMSRLAQGETGLVLVLVNLQ